MKKLLIIAAVASVALASCTKTIPVAYDNGKDVAISFSPISQRVGTKANVYGEQNATYTANNAGTYESFAAWAYYTEAGKATTNPQTNDDATKGAPFFGTGSAGVTCEHQTAYSLNTDYWAPTTSYYWPRTGYLHFHAMSPDDFGTGTLAHTWGSGISITGYVAPPYTDATATDLTPDASQIDLMYSDFEFDKQRSGYAQTGGTVGKYDDDDDSGKYQHDGVDLLFRHALSLVQFKVKTAENYKGLGMPQHEFYVRKIEVLNAYNTGDFHENRANTADNKYAIVAPGDWAGKIGFYKDNTNQNAGGTDGTPYWDNFSNEVASLTPYDVTAGAAMTGTEATVNSDVSIGQVGTTLIALPQALAHAVKNVQVKVTYDYRFSANGSNWSTLPDQTITVNLSGAKGTYDPTGANVSNYVVNNWLINHKYVYTLVFKLDPIIFDPAVEAFVTVADIGVDLPTQM